MNIKIPIYHISSVFIMHKFHNATNVGKKVLETKSSDDLKQAWKIKLWGSPEPLALNAGLPSEHRSNTGK